MENAFVNQFKEHVSFEYTSLDRVVARGYIRSLFNNGSVVNLIKNLGFQKANDGVFRLLTDQLNSHIKKTAKNLGVDILWEQNLQIKKNGGKLEYVKKHYADLNKEKSNKVLCIIKAKEFVRAFTTRTFEKKDRTGKHEVVYSAKKPVSQYYIYLHDKVIGLCYLKISSYLPFECEFYFNGHNYLKQQFDLKEKTYRMDANSFVEVEDLELLKELVENLSGQEILDRINSWKNYFFKFDKGDRSTRSKLLEHEWYTNQTEISTNVIFKSPKYFNAIFDQLLAKHYTVGLPDRVSTIFGYKNKPKSESKTSQRLYKMKSCIKHWYKGNSIKMYNKGGYLLRVETTINNPGLPGQKLKKDLRYLASYMWYGIGVNNRYFETIANTDAGLVSPEVKEKLTQTVLNKSGKKIAAIDLRKESQLELMKVLMKPKFMNGFRISDINGLLNNLSKTSKINYELQKYIVRGLVKKIKKSNFYRVTKEGWKYITVCLFQNNWFANPVTAKVFKKSIKSSVSKPSIFEKAIHDFSSSLSLLQRSFGIVF